MWVRVNVVFAPRTQSADRWRREKKEMFRRRATGPDRPGAEAFSSILKTSGKEFKRDREI